MRANIALKGEIRRLETLAGYAFVVGTRGSTRRLRVAE